MRYGARISLIFGLFLGAALASAAPQPRPAQADAEVLAAEIAARAERVPEFGEIAEMARARGLRVWLFGGTAASFAHYVRWDLLREAGDGAYQAERFKYRFDNIFRPSQDIDIVVDGRAADAAAFQAGLQEKYPYFTGNKQQWEVRALRHASGDKEALLDNPDFVNQHTDSNSVGLIELTAPSPGEPAVRDLRDWNAVETSVFLRDVAQGRITFHYSRRHERTSRFRSGLNPPIFSAVRYLIKAFQFGLEPRKGDLAVIREIVRRFDPEEAPSGYVLEWLNRNGRKLFIHSIDLARSWDVLERLGLRQKLMEVEASPGAHAGKGVAWTVDKEPLRDASDRRRLKREGKPGKTARALGIDVVTHSTRDVEAYESIRRSPRGVPVVWISRENGKDENAASGDGFYTNAGRPSSQAGFPLRFAVSPDARENVDFVEVGGVLVWLTRDKLTLIPEGDGVDALQALDVLVRGGEGVDEGLKALLVRKIREATWDEKLVLRASRTIDRQLNRKDASRIELIRLLNDFPPLRKLPGFLGWAEKLTLGLPLGDSKHSSLLFTAEAVENPEWPRTIVGILEKLDPARRILLALPLVESPDALSHRDFAMILDRIVTYAEASGGHALRAPLYIKVMGHPAVQAMPGFPDWVNRLVRLQQGEKDLEEGLGRMLGAPAAFRDPRWSSWAGTALRDHGTANWHGGMEKLLLSPPVLARKDWGTLALEAIRGNSYEDNGRLLGFSEISARPEWPRLARAALAAAAGIRSHKAFRLQRSILLSPNGFRLPEWPQLVERFFRSASSDYAVQFAWGLRNQREEVLATPGIRRWIGRWMATRKAARRGLSTEFLSDDRVIRRAPWIRAQLRRCQQLLVEGGT